MRTCSEFAFRQMGAAVGAGSFPATAILQISCFHSLNPFVGNNYSDQRVRWPPVPLRDFPFAHQPQMAQGFAGFAAVHLRNPYPSDTSSPFQTDRENEGGRNIANRRSNRIEFISRAADLTVITPTNG